jgi:CheY-like chemotaxis protein
VAKILLAEDYDDLREMIAELLQGLDHSVDAFDNGDDADSALRTKNFDLVILDWDLPNRHGIDICRDYRAGGGTTPVLILTGKKAISDKEAGFDAGADDYLTKPFHPKELTSRIKALLRRAASSPPVPMVVGELEPGTTFAERYSVLSTLGRGSTGIIYKAQHLFLNRLVALKVLHPQLVSEAESVARFKREAQAVSGLSHPNIIAVYDFGITPAGLPYLVMDYSEGQSLAQLIAERGKLSFNEALPLFIQTCEALAHAHACGIIHRDIKPGNMLIVTGDDGKDQLKIVDFGIAKMPAGGEAMQITQNGDVLGSPLYMSPEQCMGADLDARTDIYSLGCVMYTVLVGQEPFVGENVLDTMYRRTVEEPRPFGELRSDLVVPSAMEQVVMKALRRERDKRYQSMRALQADLEQLSCLTQR